MAASDTVTRFGSCLPFVPATAGHVRVHQRRITAAGFPRAKWLSDFGYAANPHIQPAVIAQPRPARG